MSEVSAQAAPSASLLPHVGEFLRAHACALFSLLPAGILVDAAIYGLVPQGARPPGLLNASPVERAVAAVIAAHAAAWGSPPEGESARALVRAGVADVTVAIQSTAVEGSIRLPAGAYAAEGGAALHGDEKDSRSSLARGNGRDQGWPQRLL